MSTHFTRYLETMMVLSLLLGHCIHVASASSFQPKQVMALSTEVRGRISTVIVITTNDKEVNYLDPKISCQSFDALSLLEQSKNNQTFFLNIYEPNKINSGPQTFKASPADFAEKKYSMIFYDYELVMNVFDGTAKMLKIPSINGEIFEIELNGTYGKNQRVVGKFSGKHYKIPECKSKDSGEKSLAKLEQAIGSGKFDSKNATERIGACIVNAGDSQMCQESFRDPRSNIVARCMDDKKVLSKNFKCPTGARYTCSISTGYGQKQILWIYKEMPKIKGMPTEKLICPMGVFKKL